MTEGKRPNWWIRWFGLDPIDLAIHVMATGFVMVLLDEFTSSEPLTIMAGFAGVVLYGIRRRRILDALPAATSPGETPLPQVLREVQDQQADLMDHLERRVLELEERLDFAERMLARPAAEVSAAPDEISPQGGKR